MASQKRLIDANAFRDFLEVIRQDYREEDTLSSGFAACLIETVQDEYLSLAPTVDAVEVVRCFECRKEGTEECPMVCKDSIFRILYAETRPDDFCSYGERKPKEDGDAGGGQAEK